MTRMACEGSWDLDLDGSIDAGITVRPDRNRKRARKRLGTAKHGRFHNFIPPSDDISVSHWLLMKEEPIIAKMIVLLTRCKA